MKIQPRFDAKSNHIGYYFNCPACKENHAVSKGWEFNGDYAMPTFRPSVLVTGKTFTPSGLAYYEAWYAAGCPPREGRIFESVSTVCHSFVTDGHIEFLSDCSHALANTKVELPDIS